MVELAFSGIDITKGREKEPTERIFGYKEKILDTLQADEQRKKIKESLPDMHAFYENNHIPQKYLENAERFIRECLNTKKELKESIYEEIMQIIQGKRFLILANKKRPRKKKIGKKPDDAYIKFEIEKNIRKDQEIGDKKIIGDLVMRRHIDKGADISRMTDMLLEGARLIRSIPAYRDIRFILSNTRLNDSDFMKYRKEQRQKDSNKRRKTANLIDMVEQEDAIGITAGSSEGKEGNRHKRVNKDSDLGKIITEYERSGKKLKVVTRLFDIDKLEQENTGK